MTGFSRSPHRESRLTRGAQLLLQESRHRHDVCRVSSGGLEATPSDGGRESSSTVSSTLAHAYIANSPSLGVTLLWLTSAPESVTGQGDHGSRASSGSKAGMAQAFVLNCLWRLTRQVLHRPYFLSVRSARSLIRRPAKPSERFLVRSSCRRRSRRRTRTTSRLQCSGHRRLPQLVRFPRNSQCW